MQPPPASGDAVRTLCLDSIHPLMTHRNAFFQRVEGAGDWPQNGTMRSLDTLRFDNSYGRLPDTFYTRLAPTPLAQPFMISFNPDAAALIDLQLDTADYPQAAELLSGVRPLPGSDPLAMVYAGHQFGHFAGQLGDGRAILLGEALGSDGRRWDLHLKGGGETPYSRAGDGRAVLRSSIREYLCGEAMHHLGIPSSRALCLLGSHEEVYRESIESGAMIVRMAPSHVRFGSFEHFYYSGKFDELQQLGDYVIAQHYPDLCDHSNRYLELLRQVSSRTAALMAHWQRVGFAHGVMNTDNMSILGLTLDYGPFGFLDGYNPGYICNHSDHHGRYAFDRQPEIGQWNISCLAQAMLPLLALHGGSPDEAAEQARAVIDDYRGEYQQHYQQALRAKLGLNEQRSGDPQLAERLLALMAKTEVDYSRCFRLLSQLSTDAATAIDTPARDLFVDREAFDAWAGDYRARLRAEHSDDRQRHTAMNAVNPAYILRNYLAQQAIDQAEKGDYSEVNRLLELLRHPYEDQPGMQHYAAEPPDWGRRMVLSCSS